MDLDVFLREQNIKLYRKLLNPETGSIERQTIFKLLAEEIEKLRASDGGHSTMSSLNEIKHVSGATI
jgi:hypothetical protein